jgi:hypothetical protein
VSGVTVRRDGHKRNRSLLAVLTCSLLTANCLLIMLAHFYRCFGCSRRHDAREEATRCCEVVQEIFECKACGSEFASRKKAEQHLRDFHQEGMCSSGQSYAGGWGNFSTP